MEDRKYVIWAVAILAVGMLSVAAGPSTEPKDGQAASFETIKGKAESQGKHKKQSGGRGQYGDCWIRIEPNRGKGFEYVDVRHSAFAMSSTVPPTPMPSAFRVSPRMPRSSRRKARWVDEPPANSRSGTGTMRLGEHVLAACSSGGHS